MHYIKQFKSSQIKNMKFAFNIAIFEILMFQLLFDLKKYGGLEAKELKRIKELEEENARLKKMYANLAWYLKTRAKNKKQKV